jgi:hypothetical protein
LKGHDFTGCGEPQKGSRFKCFVTGHDFSRADKANQINVGLQPLQMSLPVIPPSVDFFSKMFSRADGRPKGFVGFSP